MMSSPLPLACGAAAILAAGCVHREPPITPEPPDAGLILHVAPAGDDTWSGRLPKASRTGTDGPFRTLERARDAIRALAVAGPIPAGGVTVLIHEGLYELANPLALTSADSGTPTAPIVYRSAPGERVRLIGGRVVSGWTPIREPEVLARLDESVRPHVLQADLPAQGITDLPRLTAPRWAESDAGLELFWRATPMTLARWPNDGYSRIAGLCVEDGWKIHGVPGSRTGQFIYEGDRPNRWRNETDVWLHGYWFWDWADQRMRVQEIDPAKHTITLAPQPEHQYGFRKGQWYYALNLLCELDQPGEWYLDRDRGILYFWPPEPLQPGDTVVSVLPGLVTMDDVSHVTLRGLTLEAGRGTAIRISGGSANHVVGCVIRNLGKGGVAVLGGTNHRVTGCDLYQLGEGGITLRGGDRPTLTAGGHVADNNHIHHCSRWNLLYKPGIALDGVGLQATHNLLHDLPHVAIGFTGNEHLIEFNEIHSVVYHANDAGAVYTTGASETWTMRGHVIRYNYLHHIYGFEGRGCMGVYLDDAFSSIHLYGNIFWQVPRAAFIGGGRDNRFENNIFVDCSPAIHVDSRGLGWMAGSYPYLEKELKSLPYTQPPWSTRYPQLLTLLDDEPMAPKGNVVARNICVGGRWDEIDGRARPGVAMQDNLLDADPLFVDGAGGDFRLRAGSPALALGFRPIPAEQIGLYRSPVRASWPVRHALRPAPATRPSAPPATPSRLAPPKRFQAARIPAVVTIDGDLRPGEWQGLAPEKALVIEQDLAGSHVAPPCRAWVATAGSALLVAFENSLGTGQALRVGSQWGADDAVEIALRDPAAGPQAPTIILRGYANGAFESSAEAGAPPGVVKRASQGVRYAARIDGPARWLAEWQIPFAALGVDPAHQRELQFNLSVRRTAGDQWLMWQATGSYTWLVPNAGLLRLPAP